MSFFAFFSFRVVVVVRPVLKTIVDEVARHDDGRSRISDERGFSRNPELPSNEPIKCKNVWHTKGLSKLLSHFGGLACLFRHRSPYSECRSEVTYGRRTDISERFGDVSDGISHFSGTFSSSIPVFEKEKIIRRHET